MAEVITESKKNTNPDQKPKVVLDITDHDVLFGRGAPTFQHPGNVRFRELVTNRKSEYLSTKQHGAKKRIAQDIINDIAARNGRFLREIKTSAEAIALGIPVKTRAWVVVSDDAIDNKVKQALREGYDYKTFGAGDVLKYEDGKEKQTRETGMEQSQDRSFSECEGGTGGMSTIHGIDVTRESNVTADCEQSIAVLSTTTANEPILNQGQLPQFVSSLEEQLQRHQARAILSNPMLDFSTNVYSNTSNTVLNQQRLQFLQQPQMQLRHYRNLIQSSQLSGILNERNSLTTGFLGNLPVEAFASGNNIQQQLNSIAAIQRRNELETVLRQVGASQGNLLFQNVPTIQQSFAELRSTLTSPLDALTGHAMQASMDLAGAGTGGTGSRSDSLSNALRSCVNNESNFEQHDYTDALLEQVRRNPLSSSQLESMNSTTATLQTATATTTATTTATGITSNLPIQLQSSKLKRKRPPQDKLDTTLEE